MTANVRRERITVAILALGGQGGGVLADWIRDVACRNGYRVQGTSVPGVAQRTGSTVYYIEMIPQGSAGDNRREPVLALNPVPGDIDVVIASELMETGRAILRGFVTRERTILIGSTHRIYAISEKAALGNGIGNGDRILAAAERRARRFIGFDMDAAATSAGSMISSVMFGALAASGALPFESESFEEAIRAGGKSVAANLTGFAIGVERANTIAELIAAGGCSPGPTTTAGRALAKQIECGFAAPARGFALEGVKRLMDYQDRRYAELYLNRLATVQTLDADGREANLTRETARHLALWMAYDDTIRVADLKIRASRSARVEREVGLKADQVMDVTEYMHPRLRELCESMPAGLARVILASPVLVRRLAPFFRRGRHVETTSLRWFLTLRLMAGLRRFRRGTLRYLEENARIEAWLDLVRSLASDDPALATEVVKAQRLIKGYGDTFERGLRSFAAVTGAVAALRGRRDAAERVEELVRAALADEQGTALAEKLSQLEATYAARRSPSLPLQAVDRHAVPTITA